MQNCINSNLGVIQQGVLHCRNFQTDFVWNFINAGDLIK